MTRAGVKNWKEHTTPFQRVRAITVTVSQPHSAVEIAEKAAVSVEAAREHLENLAAEGVMVAHADEEEPVYEPVPEYAREQTIQDLVNTHDENDLIELRDDLREKIETWQRKYSVQTPEDLRDHGTDSTLPEKTSDIRWIVNEWKLVEYYLDIVTGIIDD